MENRSGILRSAIHLLILLLLPAACFAFGGKVSYSNGSPAVGAQVLLMMEDPNSSAKTATPVPPRNLPTTSRPTSESFGQRTDAARHSLRPPSPVAKIKAAARTDVEGRFSFPDPAPTHGWVQIKAADGTDFATVALPAKVFANGEVAIVLQPKR